MDDNVDSMRLSGSFRAIRLASTALLCVIGLGRPTAANPDAAASSAVRPFFYDRALTAPDLAGRPLEELRLMRNTIYARAGRRFADPTLRDYFAHQPWYVPAKSGQRKLGAVDIANIRTIAEQEKRLVAEPVSVPCPEAGPAGVVGDGRLEDDLSGLARRFKWEAYGPPTTCHRRVQLACGPDIDGDGQPESIVHITWRTLLNGRNCRTIRDDNDYWDTGVTFLISGRAHAWRAVAPFGIDIEGDQQDMHSSAYFVRHRGGEILVRSSTSNVASDTMCTMSHYTTWRLGHGKLRSVEEGDDSPPCDGAE